ncbi:hypothetical protein [Nocardia sp. NPDC003979]
MTIGETRELELIRRLTSPSPDIREDACGTVTDWIHSFSPEEVHTLSSLIATLAVVEQNPKCRESQLHALSELVDSGHLRASDLFVLKVLDQNALTNSENEYLEYLQEELL